MYIDLATCIVWLQNFVIEQTSPQKVCTQIGLCVFDGTHSVRSAELYINYSCSICALFLFS
jgi:hypothetical protein